MIERIRVKTKKLAKRCEICHQKDYFDAEKEVCLRCVEYNSRNASINEREVLLNKFKGTADPFGRTNEYLYLDLMKPEKSDSVYFQEYKESIINYKRPIQGTVFGVVLGFVGLIFLNCVNPSHYIQPLEFIYLSTITALVGFLGGWLFELLRLCKVFDFIIWFRAFIRNIENRF
jgi:hypothetical protein